MKKIFDENICTDTKPNDWENISISGKWTPVVIESPDIIDFEDTTSMIMRIDPMFDPEYPYCGNDLSWMNFCRSYASVPEDLPLWLRDYYEWGEDTREELESHFREECEKFNKSWGRNPYGVSDGTVFGISLFASPYIGGPYSFVNYKTGKVGLIHNIGKWPESVGASKEELEWITKTWPKYKFFVTFCDDECYGHEKDTKALCTLMLYNGEIKQVTTREYKDWKYVYKINHLKGSTCAKNPSFIKRIIWDTELWKITRNIPSTRKIKVWFMEIIAKRFFHNMYNEYVIKYNHNLSLCPQEHYFDEAHVKAVIEDWRVIRNKLEKED